LKRLVAISNEANELKLFLAQLRDGLPEPSGEPTRLLEWAEARLRRLEGGLKLDSIAAALDEQKLLPEIDHLPPLETEEN
jgi:hypothetical protein